MTLSEIKAWPRPATKFARWQAAGLSLYLVAVTALVFWGMHGRGYDDPFITYRYAWNLAHGQGFVYNPGQHVLSTTTPLLALLLAGLSLGWHNLPQLANLTGALGVAFGAVFLWDLAHTWKTPAAGWAALTLYPSVSLLLITLGSETPLYIAFCLGALAAYARRAYAPAGLLAGLATLARPDGVLVPAALALDFVWRAWRSRPARQPWPWQAALVYLAVTLPWFGFAWFYFGSPLPATLAAKQHQGALAAASTFAGGFLPLAGTLAQNEWAYGVEAALAAVGLVWAFWKGRSWLLLIGWTALYFGGYSLLHVSRYLWYYAPLAPAFLTLAGLGLAALTHFGPRIPAGKFSFRSGALLAGLLLAALAAVQAHNLWKIPPDPRLPVYQDIGNWLRLNTPPQALTAVLETGVIGFYAQRPMVDFAGLIDPAVAGQLGPSSDLQAAAIWTAERYHPDYLVIQAGLMPELERGYLAQHCRPAASFSGATYGSFFPAQVIYACK